MRRRNFNIRGLLEEYLAARREARRVYVGKDGKFSPAFDNPQRVSDVAAMFERNDARVTFAGFVKNGSGEAAVVRGVKHATQPSKP